jgi:hypothetical protein
MPKSYSLQEKEAIMHSVADAIFIKFAKRRRLYIALCCRSNN